MNETAKVPAKVPERLITDMAIEKLSIAKDILERLKKVRALLTGINVTDTVENAEVTCLRDNEKETNNTLNKCIELLDSITDTL